MTSLLLDRGADPDHRGYNYWPPIFYIAYNVGYEYGDSEAAAEMIKLLLDADADPDAENQEGSGWTTLHQAAYNDLEEVAQALLDGGADRKAEDSNGANAVPDGPRPGQLHRHPRSSASSAAPSPAPSA